MAGGFAWEFEPVVGEVIVRVEEDFGDLVGLD